MASDTKLILLQRTQLDSDTLTYKISRIFLRIMPFLFDFQFTVRAFINKKLINERYENGMEDDYKTFKEYLPNISNPTIVDIGAGMAGNDIFINRHYMGKARFVLVDKDQVDERVHFGYAPEGSFYSANGSVRSYLGSHGINLEQMNPEQFLASDIKVDVVISLYSWGFHYPIKTYIQKVAEILKPGGILIIDVRKIPNWEKELIGFRIKTIVKQDHKFGRVIAEKVTTLD